MSGRDETIDAMAQRLGIKRDILSAQMRLTYLAPDIVRALVLGRPVDGLTPAGLLKSCKDLPRAAMASCGKGSPRGLRAPSMSIHGR